MKISVEVTGAQEQQLAEAARRLNIPPAEMAAAAIRDLVTQPDAEFDRAARRVLEKNRERYERLR